MREGRMPAESGSRIGWRVAAVRLRGPRRRVAVALLALGLGACETDGTRFLTLGTGGTGGIYYPLGGAMAGALSEGGSRRVTAEVTGGSVENVNRILAGQMDLGFAVATTAWEVAHGGGDAGQRLRVVAPLYPNVTHLLVARGVEAASVAELRGMRISVGAAGSGTEQVTRHLLAAHGLEYDDVRPSYLSFNESAAALRDRAIDAAVLSVGYPASAVLEALTGGARLVPLGAGTVETLVQRYPFYTEGRIPAGIYPGVEEPLRTVSVLNWVVAAETLDEDVVRAVLDLVAGGRERLARVHEIARQIELSALERPPAPLHPAAAAWWREHGSDPISTR